MRFHRARALNWESRGPRTHLGSWCSPEEPEVEFLLIPKSGIAPSDCTQPSTSRLRGLERHTGYGSADAGKEEKERNKGIKTTGSKGTDRAVAGVWDSPGSLSLCLQACPGSISAAYKLERGFSMVILYITGCQGSSPPQP